MNWLQRLFGVEPVIDGPTLYIWPDGKMAFQSGDMRLGDEAVKNIKESLHRAQADFLAGKPIVVDGYIRVVKAA